MKKLRVFGSLFLFIFMISLVSAVRINEVMVDPERCPDSDCEYIEIYTDNPVNLINWNINTSNQDYDFDFYLEDYLIITADKEVFISNFSVNESKVIEWKGISLHNNGESVFLFDNSSSLVNNFYYNSSHSGLSWQFCDDSWIESMPTPNSLNNCSISQQNQNNSQQNDTENDVDTEEIYLELDWDEDDIENGEEFYIEVKAYNLNNEDYDIKIYIKKEDENTIISETYHDTDEDWKSGTYYIDELLNGPDDDSEDVKLRIKNSYDDFDGDAEIVAKIREAYSSSIIDEITEDIEIIEKKGESVEEERKENDEKDAEKETVATVTGNVIKLGNVKENVEEKVKTENSEEIVYESVMEKVKKNAIYGLNFLLIIIIIFLLFEKKILKGKKLRKIKGKRKWWKK